MNYSIMLALKVNQSVTIRANPYFDEIDTGVGGVTASMGHKLQSISQKQQLICISHFTNHEFGESSFHIEKALLNATTIAIRYLSD